MSTTTATTSTTGPARPAWATSTYPCVGGPAGIAADGAHYVWVDVGEMSVEVTQCFDHEGPLGPVEALLDHREPINAQQCRDLAAALVKAAEIVEEANAS